ncbi:MAG: hypothetical protein GY711_02275 [bacterium]|nr:hypothetical protein [bacterium]
MRPSLLQLTLSTTLTLATAAAQTPDPNYVLEAGHVAGMPGDTVSVPVLFTNTGSNVDAWQFSLGVPSPLINDSGHEGATTAALNNDNGPDFNGTLPRPGGFTVGVLISFMSTRRGSAIRTRWRRRTSRMGYR